MTTVPMSTDFSQQQGFWSAVRDVVRCNRKDGKRWQCSREVVPGQKYCERHVGRGRNRPKRSAEAYSATSDVPCTPSLGAISSVSMAAAAQGGVTGLYNGWQQPSPMPRDRPNHGSRETARPNYPTGFEKVARVKLLYDRVRSNFPYFDPAIARNAPIFMENAGGSQCPHVVIDAVFNYMRTSYVQLGADYELSRRATETVRAAHDHMKTFTNAHGFGDIAFGPSTSQLLTNLSNSYSNFLKEGDEVIIHEANHEANAAPWLRLAARCGASVKWWRINYDTFDSDLDDLAHLLSPRTRIIAVPHVSNLLGEILDLERVVKVVKSRIYENRPRIVADGVAYAPHRAIDVGRWGVDWYVFSTYKVYGPHMAVLYGSQEAFADIRGETPNWDFLTSDDPAKALEVGGVCHEACAGLVALTQYFAALSGIGEAFSLSSEASKKELQQHANGQDSAGPGENGGFTLFDTNPSWGENASLSPPVAERKLVPGSLDLQPMPTASMDGMTSSSFRDWEFALQGTSFGLEDVGLSGTVSARLDRVVVEAAYDIIALLEQPLQEKLLAFLRSRPDVVIVGPKSASVELRVPTVSFIHRTKTSADISNALQSGGFAIRHGNMYSYRLVSGLAANKKLGDNSVDEGVVRISMVHYNTPLEVARLISCLQAVL